MKSKKELFKLVAKRFHFAPEAISIGVKSIEDETYGRQSMIYFFNIVKEWGISRREFERLLEGWGFKVNRRYWPEADAAEVQVSYFKGWHWDE